MSDWIENDEPCPCDNCVMDCDIWDSSHCCIYCEWLYGDGCTPCDTCDPMDVQEASYDT